MRPELIAPTLLVLAIGLHWTWTYLSLLLHARRSREWPSTSGVVLGRYAADMDGVPDIRSYAAGVRYEYTVDGVSYRSAVVSRRYAFPFWSIRRVVKIQQPYPAGASVQVFHDPDCPERAVLEPGDGAQNYLAAAISLAVLFAGLRMLAEVLGVTAAP
ncbi:MAG TPA: DUF3592 domain-containing protein [Longimicrobium sp.]|jgi:hypothetical protein